MRQSDPQCKLGFKNENDYFKQDVTDEEEEEVYAPSCMRRKSVFNRSDVLHSPISVTATVTTTVNTITATAATSIGMEEETWRNATNSTTIHNNNNNNNNTIICPPMHIEDMIYHGSEIRSMIGYTKTKWSKVWICLSLGLLWIIGHWSHWLKAKLFFKECPLGEANHVLVQDFRNRYQLIKVKKLCIKDVPYTNEDSVEDIEYRVFEYNYLRYLYVERENKFLVQCLDAHEVLSKPHRLKNGLDSRLHRSRLLEFGANSINLSSKPFKLFLNYLKKELIRPMYLFQFVLLLIWLIVRRFYWYFAFSLVITLLIIIFDVYTKCMNSPEKYLSEWVKNTGREVRVIRDGVSFMVGSSGLAPGDVIEINSRITLPCDLILIRGTVEVDESALTGDTAHARKVPVFPESNSYTLPQSDFVIQPENVLIGGSKVLSYTTRDDECPLAVVIRTGFNTSRGRLIRQYLLSQGNEKVSYTTEISKFILTFFIIGILTIVFTVLFARFGVTKSAKAYKPYLDLMLTLCPPFIPLVAWIPVLVASRNVKKGGIQKSAGAADGPLMKFGLIDCICYDKTGTLTQSILALYGVLEMTGNELEDIVKQITHHMDAETVNVMAACHNLNNVNHVATGDALEEELFRKSGYTLTRDKDSNSFIAHPPAAFNHRGIIEVVNIFPFSTKLQRASVIVRLPSPCIYTKGSHTSILKICNPNTIPKNYRQLVQYYGLKGFRVIAFAKRKLNQDFKKDMTRSECEKDMTFLGFFLMKNKLQPESKNEIHVMQKARILTKMITGDSIYTAVSVARECILVDPSCRILVAEVKMEKNEANIVWIDVDNSSVCENIPIDDANIQLAITGDAFSLLRNYCQNYTQKLMYQKLLIRCHIFGEMLSEQKAELINDLKEMHLYVAMVGDGANDSLALITSDVGFSLSDADISFAAEFCADVNHCLPSFMVRHARALLDMITVNFKFVLLFIIIQYTLTLFNHIHVLKQRQVIWSSLCGFLLLISMSFNRPSMTIHKQAPSKHIMCMPFIISIILQALVQIVCLNAVIIWLEKSKWFIELRKGNKHDHIIEELCTSYLFQFTNFQYLIVALTFNFNCKYSKSLTNVFFIIIFLALLVLNLIVLFPFSGDISIMNAIQTYIWENMFEIKFSDADLFPYARNYLYQRIFMLCIVVINLFLSLFLEFIWQRVVAWYRRRFRSTNNLTYRKIIRSIPSMSKWI
jgi:predicted P-type ATPase